MSMESWIFSQEYSIDAARRGAVDARTLRTSGSALRGTRVTTLGATRGLGALTPDQCRVQLSQIAPTYLDAITTFFIVSALKTPSSAKVRAEQLFGADLRNCMINAPLSNLTEAQKKDVNDATIAFGNSLQQRYGIDPKTLGFEGWTVGIGFAALYVRHNYDADKVYALIDKGLKLESRNEWTASWKDAWDKEVAPWYEKPLVLAGLSALVIGGAYFVSKR